MKKINEFIKRSGGVDDSIALINYELSQVTKIMSWYSSLISKASSSYLLKTGSSNKLRDLKADYVGLCILKRTITNAKV